MAYNRGNSFMEPFEQGERIEQEKERTALQQQRQADMDQMNAQRMQLVQAQIKRIQALTNNMYQKNKLMGGQQALGWANLAERKREFDENQKNQLGGANIQQNRQLKLQMQGLPFVRQTANGDQGLFRMPTGNEASSLEKVIDAYPQLSTAIDQIGQGTSYMQTNFPGDVQKYSTAMIAYMAGDASPKQEKLLEKSGISLDALIQAAETAQRVMNIAKTNEGMRQAFDLFMPRKGDTAQSYLARMNTIKNNFNERYWMAQYQLQGIPLKAVGGEVPNPNAALEDMNNFVKSNVANTAPVTNNATVSALPTGITEADIQAAMKANPSATRDQIIALLVKMRSGK
jgi:hypothetical protein